MHEIHPPSAAEYVRFLPEIILTVVGVLVMVLEAVTNERQKRSLGFLRWPAFWPQCLAPPMPTVRRPGLPEHDHGRRLRDFLYRTGSGDRSLNSAGFVRLSEARGSARAASSIR